MNPINNFEKVKAVAEKVQLPVGGYILKIIGAKEVEYSGPNGPFKKLEIGFDIAEGEFEGYYQQDYDNQTQEDKRWKGVLRVYSPTGDGTEQDEYRQRILKGITNAIEDSNSGYHWDWDEKQWKGKMVGGLFRREEWQMNGREGWTTKCFKFLSLDDVRDGKFSTPKDKPLKNKEPAAPVFQPVEDEDDGFMPF